MNAKLELVRELEGAGKVPSDVLAFVFIYGRGWRCSNEKNELKAEGRLLQHHLDWLDFDYDDGYGGQELFGLVLFDDGSWLERYEYDGSECWSYKYSPTVQDVLEYKG